ncbi:ABC transporter permease [Ruicaihuangia caeni]|uniref:ABC transporter permease n=1 Tax=Ruicaihuangia caeni TaxID=3042517 RepID=A0AAW6T5U2_9MICO|nr:ABC transporter permease [Klugiella sp. YN-L-19]MDI2099200.1 ABC transporter permease [Klugiella sp. YN-L-19]
MAALSQTAEDRPARLTDARPAQTIRNLFARQTTWIVVIFIALIVTFGVIAGPAFASLSNARNILASVAILLVLSLGQMLVVLTAGIDLSGGGILVFSGVVATMTMNAMGGLNGILTGLVVGIAAGAGWGLVNGLLVTRAKIPPIIATLGTLGMTMGLALVITDGIDLRAPLELVQTLGVGDIAGAVPWIAVIALLLALVAAVVLNETVFGRRTYAVGASSAAAERAGIRVSRHLVVIYTIAGALAGIAGFLALARFGTTTLAGHSEDSLKAITAVVLGGTSLFGGSGKVVGTVIGAFIPVILLNGFVITGVQAFWQQFAIGLVLVVAVFIDRIRHSPDRM